MFLTLPALLLNEDLAISRVGCSSTMAMADVDLARVGALIGDRRRAGMLLALLSGQELTAGELAARAGASSSLASAHLTRLLAGGMVCAERSGRTRRYRIASPEVAEALEALGQLAPPRPAQSLREVRAANALRHARTCYDHLAGELGVGLTDALIRQGVLASSDGGLALTRPGELRLQALGVDVAAARASRRVFARQCIDWTERRPHLAGALGAAVAGRLFELGWIERLPGGRALTLTTDGAGELRARFALSL
jgi:DNA-binding transcriptional ArsR family regulator